MLFKQLLYVSRDVHGFSKADISKLMKHARAKNTRHDVTGLFLMDGDMFLQILEGPEASVDKIFGDIQRDNRHKDIDVIYTNPECKQRQFARWRMDCKVLGDGMPDEFGALDDRLKSILRMAEPNGEMAHNLMLDFRKAESEYFDI